MPTPTWYHPLQRGSLASSTERHQWMCAQLQQRRRSQTTYASVFQWIEETVESVVGCRLAPVRIFEVLADGLGYMEPYWHAIDYSAAHPAGTTSSAQMSGLRERIRDLRNKHLKKLSAFPTQRAIGGRLYEPALFMVNDEGSHFFRGGQWRKAGESELPLKCDSDEANLAVERTTIHDSLTELSRLVLWPAFFENEGGHHLSFVFLHTSLWQSVGGVWAMHLCCEKQMHAPGLCNERLLRSVLEPAVRCLDDVMGWANEEEGSHSRRRRNVDLFFRATGRDAPVWTTDGVSGAFDEADRKVYELEPIHVGGEETSRIFDQAVRWLAEGSSVQWPRADAVLRTTALRKCVRALFVGGVSGDQEGRHSGQTNGGASLEEVTAGYVDSVLRTLEPEGVTRARPTSLAEWVRLIARYLREVPEAEWRAWCAVELRVVCLAGCAGGHAQELAKNETDAERVLEILADPNDV